uniref:Uncharacterized protein n=1 Tax=Xanthomonas campestris TaxID=339 RepID=O06467_XANCA|nr:unknown [Xanthomonas campestris]
MGGARASLCVCAQPSCPRLAAHQSAAACSTRLAAARCPRDHAMYAQRLVRLLDTDSAAFAACAGSRLVCSGRHAIPSN